LDANVGTVPTLRRHSTNNVLHMPHGAPMLMQALLDASGTDAPWIVRLNASRLASVGNIGGERGGVAARLILVGLRLGLEPDEDGLPVFASEGRDLLRIAGPVGT
jgi:hypothetical protein